MIDALQFFINGKCAELIDRQAGSRRRVLDFFFLPFWDSDHDAIYFFRKIFGTCFSLCRRKCTFSHTIIISDSKGQQKTVDMKRKHVYSVNVYVT